MKHSNKEIQEAIINYASSYSALEVIQQHAYGFPKGDQKTGSIGEYYTYLYLKNKYAEAKVEHCVIDNQGWDICLTINEQVEYIQIKTVSGFSLHRRISPIKDGFSKLYLLSLDKEFYPNSFWIIDRIDINSKFPIRHKNMRVPTDKRIDQGKGILKYSLNYIDDFKRNIQEAIEKNIQ